MRHLAVEMGDARTHDETKWVIKFSGGEVLQAQSAQRFAIFSLEKSIL